MHQEQKRKQTLLVIDDSQSFLDSLQSQVLAEEFRVVPVRYQIGSRLDNILEKIRDARPDHLVLDLNLGAPGNSQTLLRQAVEKEVLPLECQVWIISQDFLDQGQQEQVLVSFSEIHINVSERLLTKPIDPLLLRAELLDEVVYIPAPPLDESFPLPLRVLARSGKVVFHNPLWENVDVPPPTDFSAWLDQGGVPEQRTYVGTFLGGGDRRVHVGYRVFSFALDEGKFLGQVVATWPVSAQGDTLEEALDIVFSAMRAAGFPRGRYYRMTPLEPHPHQDTYETNMTLLRAEPPPVDLELPYRFPLQGLLKERFSELMQGENIPWKSLGRELVFMIRKISEDQERPDAIISRLNKAFNIQEKTVQSWLEIPVYLREMKTMTGEKQQQDHSYRMAGLLVFDPYESPAEEASPRPAKDQEWVSEGRVRTLQDYLLSLLFLLTATLKKEENRKLRQYDYRMRQLDQKLTSESETIQRYRLVLKALQQHSKAGSAFLAIKTRSNDLKIVAAQGKNQDVSFLENIRFPLDADILFCQAFQDKKPMVSQDYPAVEYQEKIRLLIKSGHAICPPEQQDRFLEWLQTIRSVAAVPVMVDDATIIGTIALQYDQPWEVTRQRMNSVRAILHRVRLVLQQARQQERGRIRGKLIGHDLRTTLSILEQAINLFADEYPDIIRQAEDRVREIRVSLQDALDQVYSLDLEWDASRYPAAPFFPLEPVQEYLDLSAARRQRQGIYCRITPGWQDPVWSVPIFVNREVFSRIARNLLHNSFKYGRKAVDRDQGEAQPVHIQIRAKRQQAAWRLSIINPGQMTPEEYQARFEERPDFQDQLRDGAHIALAAAKFWASQMGCMLSLENRADRQVEAVLECPLARDRQQGEEHEQ